jgi:hypothetical protein
MNDRELETRLRARYRARASETESAPLSLRQEVAAIARTATPRRRLFGRGRGITLLAAAAALVLVGGALAAGSGVLRLRSNVPPPAASFGPVAVASQTTPPSPSKSASPTPSPTASPITWSTASLGEDWPAPVRSEPAGRPTVVPILLRVVVHGTNCPGDCSYSSTSGILVDPRGDNGSNAFPSADIQDVSFCGDTGTCLKIGFVSNQADAVDPSHQWFAYGVVVDTDGDGVADWRYGIDNEPVGTPGSGSPPRRWWRTNLHTGRTEWTPSGEFGGLSFFWGNHDEQTGGSGLSFGGDTTGGVQGGVPKRFYAWASVIQDGRVVATDYAPDAGWLVPSPNAKP